MDIVQVWPQFAGHEDRSVVPIELRPNFRSPSVVREIPTITAHVHYPPKVSLSFILDSLIPDNDLKTIYQSYQNIYNNSNSTIKKKMNVPSRCIDASRHVHSGKRRAYASPFTRWPAGKGSAVFFIIFHDSRDV